MKFTWRVLSDEELVKRREEQKKEAVKNKFITIVLVVLMFSFIDKLGIPTRGNPYPDPRTWKEIFTFTIPVTCIIGIFITYLFGDMFSDCKDSRIICQKCEKEAHSSEEKYCECGGTFYPVEEMVCDLHED
jgi:hypothetical protein